MSERRVRSDRQILHQEGLLQDQAENARLREALYEITTETLVYNGVPEIEQIGAIARAALEEK